MWASRAGHYASMPHHAMAGMMLGPDGLVSSASGASGAHRFERPPADEVDHLAREGKEAVLRIVQNPQPPDAQAPLFLIDADRNPVDPNEIQPNTVIVHVYDLKEGFTRANDVLAFSFENAAIGGVFHAGVEVFGSEWTYGVHGVTADPPRTVTGHVYNCSIFLGPTPLDRTQVAELIVEVLEEWRGADYELLNHNCCSLAAEFCDALEVGPLPPWINRFARILHQGRRTGKYLGHNAVRATRVIGQQAQQFQVMARPHVRYLVNMFVVREESSTTLGSCSPTSSYAMSPMASPVSGACVGHRSRQPAPHSAFGFGLGRASPPAVSSLKSLRAFHEAPASSSRAQPGFTMSSAPLSSRALLPTTLTAPTTAPPTAPAAPTAALSCGSMRVAPGSWVVQGGPHRGSLRVPPGGTFAPAPGPIASTNFNYRQTLPGGAAPSPPRLLAAASAPAIASARAARGYR